MFINHIYLTILSVGLISSQNIQIKIVPEIIIIGQNLFVSCSVSEASNHDRFDVFLRCPFNTGDSRCIQNCKSRTACIGFKCNDKAVGDQYFTCHASINSTNTAFNYYFAAVTRAFLNYSKTVNFACFYKGQQVNRLANVSEPSTMIKTISPTTTTQIFDKPPNLMPQPDIRLIILVSLIGALMVSFFVNVYCSVQLCISRSKKRNNRRNPLNNDIPLSQQLQDMHSNHYSNEISSQYISHDNIKRTKSQPSLSNNERNTPTHSNYNYSNVSNPESGVSKLRFSRPNTLTLDNETSNGSRNSLLTPVYGQPQWNPLQLPFVYFAQYPTIFIPNSQITVDNLDRVMEQDPERQSSSLFQPLPQKPDETFSDLESVFI